MLRLDGTTLVVGLGKSGLSAVRALAALGATVAVTDSRRDPPELAALRAEFPELPCHLGGFDPAVFADAARLLVSPGVAVATPVIAETAALVLFIGFEVAFEPFDVAVALECEDVRRQSVEEEAVAET